MNKNRTWQKAAPFCAVFFILVARSYAIIPPSTVFELDGNAIDQVSGSADWSDFTVGPVDDFIFSGVIRGNGLQAFNGGGSKDGLDIPSWNWRGKSTPDKTFLTDAYAAAKPFVGKHFLYFGADRYSNVGDSVLGFWYFQDNVHPNPDGTFSGHHVNGDILVVVNYGNPQTYSAFVWNNGLQQVVPETPVSQCNSPLANLCSVTNSAITPSPWPYTPKSGSPNTFPENSFMEGVLDVSSLDLGVNTAGSCFSSFMAVSRASISSNAVLKDFVFGQLNTCSLSAIPACTDVSFNEDHSELIYSYTVLITNTGLGWLNNITVTHDGFSTSYALNTLAPGDSFLFTGTFPSDSTAQFTGLITVTATTSGGNISLSTSAGIAECPEVFIEPKLQVTLECLNGQIINSDTSVLYEFSGQLSYLLQDAFQSITIESFALSGVPTSAGAVFFFSSNTDPTGIALSPGQVYFFTGTTFTVFGFLEGLHIDIVGIADYNGAPIDLSVEAPSICPVIPYLVQLRIEKYCTVGLFTDYLADGTPVSVVKVLFQGEICNDGDRVVQNIVVTEYVNNLATPLPPISVLLPSVCYGFSGTYFPSGDLTPDTVLQDTVSVSGTPRLSFLVPNPVTASQSASCSLNN